MNCLDCPKMKTCPECTECLFADVPIPPGFCDDCILGENCKFLPNPRVICLCGSTKFKQEFIEANFEETMKGNIVHSVGWFSHADGNVFSPSEDQKVLLDAVYKKKIDLSDEILVINKDGYIGESTRSEIEYAKAKGKKVRYYFK